MTKNKDDLEIVLLRSTNNNYELDLIKSLLEENNIPYIIREPGIGQHMRIIGGLPLYGTDILVEKSSFEKANNILEELPWQDER
ncbi:DUF2007 domain-containing protein [Tissierella pigra]|uniref:DUF2007 domain-containing protein n=1 Tax=Tissierella pigra TaxID=2607614 RepID=A0A6N7XUZ5_9FIRM|nr:DUF2007 domain-containing protein [Tissierella pigra]MBU5427601.1 DUF2007 domain-containing protein [Tissierella pigra]MSU00354.1 DUF2007 domain-containing protein [Tissierella pigra]